MDFSDQQFALVFSILKKTFSVRSISELEGWCEPTFEIFRDGERVQLSADENDFVVLQTGPTEQSLNQSLEYATFCRKKNISVTKIRGYIRPIRGSRRQVLPPVDVSNKLS